MKYYYTYKITCTEGSWKGKFYFGQHTTNNLDDKYITGGKKIRNFIKKYPIGYKREILAFYSSQDELNKAEYDLIHPWLNNELCLNMRDGGYKPTLGDEQKQKLHISVSKYMEDPEHRKKAGEKNKGRTPWNKGKETPEYVKAKQRKPHTVLNRKPCTEIHKKHLSEANTGKTRTIESRQKQSKTTQGHRCYILGKHRVYDNDEHTKWHFEY